MSKRKNGENSIYERGDGRWSATITTEQGKRKTIYGARSGEVVAKLARSRNQQLDHIPFSDERLTVLHWLETWLRI
jgi:hypothetical protein